MSFPSETCQCLGRRGSFRRHGADAPSRVRGPASGSAWVTDESWLAGRRGPPYPAYSCKQMGASVAITMAWNAARV